MAHAGGRRRWKIQLLARSISPEMKPGKRVRSLQVFQFCGKLDTEADIGENVTISCLDNGENRMRDPANKFLSSFSAATVPVSPATRNNKRQLGKHGESPSFHLLPAGLLWAMFIYRAWTDPMEQGASFAAYLYVSYTQTDFAHLTTKYFPGRRTWRMVWHSA